MSDAGAEEEVRDSGLAGHSGDCYGQDDLNHEPHVSVVLEEWEQRRGEGLLDFVNNPPSPPMDYLIQSDSTNWVSEPLIV